jgi:Tol biopolymer transport system component
MPTPRPRLPRGFVVIAAAAGLAALVPSAAASAQRAPTGTPTVRVSVSAAGDEGNGPTGAVSVSSDGAIAAFASDAADLVADDTNDASDVFVRDTAAGTTERVSVSSAGVQADGPSFMPSVSAGGRYVAFASRATNLVKGDRNGAMDVFLRDRLQGTTVLVSRAAGGAHGNADSSQPDLSADGRFVALTSRSSNLVPDDHNQVDDVFVKDMATGGVALASVAWNGVQANSFCIFPTVSDDGTVVGFMSGASNLVPEQDVNGADDIFVRDLAAGTTVLASAGPHGEFVEAESRDPDLSGDGRFIGFDSNGPLLHTVLIVRTYHVYLREIATGSMKIVDKTPTGTPSMGFSETPSLSRDGSRVLFASDSADLVPGDTNGFMDVFVRDMATGRTILVSISSSGVQGNGSSGDTGSELAALGRVSAFLSRATNLVLGDRNGMPDAFVHGRIG